MKFERNSGILLHPSSLPGPYGIGDLGPQAYQWVDWLASTGCKLWQVLPLGPTGYGDSPYQCFSAFAGNPYLVSPEFLVRDGLILQEEANPLMSFPPKRVDYGALIPLKLEMLEKAFKRFLAEPGLQVGFEQFCADNSAWLEDYALFMAIKESFGGGGWDAWPAEYRLREAKTLKKASHELDQPIQRHKFYQFLFFQQWNRLCEHAHSKGISIIGDIPIFVAIDSADVWAHPELFFLDEERRPTVVAGVPPDYFSPTGQLWGNPLYRWEAHKASGYAWWLERFRAVLKMVDIVRVDHFRGFAGYWEVPAGETTAVKGRWVPGPGADFFTAVRAGLVDPADPEARLPIIAEDLGVITPDVTELRESSGLPGMKVLQFAFSGPDNVFLPHHYEENCVVYTGTHDNDTTNGWYASAPEADRELVRRYMGRRPTQSTGFENFSSYLIRLAWSSVAVFALAPMQDFLGLGTVARMNYPSKLGGNWEWRMGEEAMNEELRKQIAELNFLYSR